MKRVAVCLIAAAAQPLFCAAAGLDLELEYFGGVRFGESGARLCAVIHHENWAGSSEGVREDVASDDAPVGIAPFKVFRSGDVVASGTSSLRPLEGGGAAYEVSLVSEADQKPSAIALSLSLPRSAYGDWTWEFTDGKKGVFPETFGDEALCRTKTNGVTFSSPDGGESFTLSFDGDMSLYIQDNRKWSDTFSLRITPPDAGAEFPNGARRDFACSVSASGGVGVSFARPNIIRAGKEWIPLDYAKDIEPGSALDFSCMGMLDAPAGRHGWLKVSEDGHFEFEGRPGVPQRFYGVNLCFGANFLDEKTADELVDRLARLCYNSVRIHHYDGAWANAHASRKVEKLKSQKVPQQSDSDLSTLQPFNFSTSVDVVSDDIDRLDYLLYRAFQRGIYATTDLYTSRPVLWRDIGIDRDGRIDGRLYKNLVAVYEPAFENWAAFARNFLEHVNPYTGRRYADEPAMPLISLINEAQPLWCWDELRKLEPAKTAWREWLARRRAEDPDFAKGCPDDPSAFSGDERIMFMADMERSLVARQKEFLRGLGVKALFTNQNCGPYNCGMELAGEELYDYADDHFYVDHPRFPARKWEQPSTLPNANPLKTGFLPMAWSAFARHASKPFCITEWNFSGPGMYRGVGGIMTGAMGALQDWDGLWRFAYAHGTNVVKDRTGYPGYFDVGTDPLGQASDRASICLFLRGDLAPPESSFALSVPPDAAKDAKTAAAGITPKWSSAAWRVRVALAAGKEPPQGMRTFDLAEVRDSETPPFDPPPNEAFSFDAERGSMRIVTPRTAGGFVPSGSLDAGPLRFEICGAVAPATVWASSLDGEPLPRSSRILVSHLTDAQADGNVYADRERKILVKWGAYPPLVRNGSARIELALADPSAFSVWELDTTGRRRGEIPSAVIDGKLSFTATVEGPNGARMLYEVARRDSDSEP